MKIFRDILLIIAVLGLFAYSPQLLQISSGAVQSQNVEAVLPPTDQGLYSFGWNGGNFVTGQDWRVEHLVDASEFIEIAIGSNHGLGIKANGTLWAWGSQQSGKLGNGTADENIYITIPTQIGSDTNWSKVSAGTFHSAAIKTTGTLWTWGSRLNGRLGDGNTTGSTLTPTQIGADVDWVDVSCGSDWTAAVKADDLVTTGNNASYKTGLGTNSGNTISFTIASSDNWTKCYAGVSHGIGFKGDSLWSWGLNSNGRTGQGTTSGSQQIPDQTTNLTTGWLTGSAGNLHSMAIKTDGTLYHMGQQLNGRLGNGSVTSAIISSVTQTGSDTNWEWVRLNGNSTGSEQNEFSYAIKGGSFYAVGLNSNGQLGIDPTVTAETGTWTQVGTGTNYTRIGAGGGFALGIRKNP